MGRGVDTQRAELVDRSGGEPIAAGFIAWKGRGVYEESFESAPSGEVGGGGSGGSRANDEYVNTSHGHHCPTALFWDVGRAPIRLRLVVSYVQFARTGPAFERNTRALTDE
ncbi:hypothetical protein GCM10025785_14340 [Corynebacterium canis]